MKKLLLLILIISSCFSCKDEFSEKEKQQYLTKGQEITSATFKELSGNLMKQMKAGGVEKAIPFCNQNASSLTDELSKKYNVEIKRTSDLLRNLNNKSNDRENQIIENYKKLISEEKELKPIVEIDSLNSKHFYAPIIVNSKCLACHGKINKTMTIKTDSIIKSLYEFDTATNYSEGDLRGIWSIKFNK